MHFSTMISVLQDFWIKHGCTLISSFDSEVGAGTYHPATIFLDRSRDYNIVYTQPSTRPKDARAGKSPNRLYQHLQLQILMKPIPLNPHQLVLESFELIGINATKNNIQFLANNWSSPTIGANGVGWEIRCDGQEVLQYTYFQQLGGETLTDPVLELTYGMERLAMVAQNKDSLYDLTWSDTATYKDIRLRAEEDYSYAIQHMDLDTLSQQYELYKKMYQRYLAANLYLVAYGECLKMSHAFNLMDAVGLFYTARANYIQEIRHCVGNCLKLFNQLYPSHNI